LLIGVFFIPNVVFNTGGYAWAARFGAFIFTILQQVVLIDFAYRWNDAWVEKAHELGEDHGGKSYLISLVAVSATVLTLSVAAIGVMFHYFTGCVENDLIISLTLILSVVLTVIQLSGEQGNLLASSLVTAYATFLCFSAVSKTPNSSCNPFVGETNVTTVIVGLVLTVLSLCWVCLSAAKNITNLLGGTGQIEEVEDPVMAHDSTGSGSKQKPFIQRPVEDGEVESQAERRQESVADRVGEPEPKDGGQGWRFNIVMVLIAMYFGMMLTNWGSLNTSGESNDPKNGWVAMWLTASGQWVCILLYIWTIIAPRLLPDRDFS
ncbi:unnamed protein product, partial [Discosporangium mesarthrocarpum]